MPYVVDGGARAGCIFCNRLDEEDDVGSLILHRGDRAFVIMNLFPYNTGHVMIVPNEHVSSPEIAESESLAAVAALEGPVLRALRRSLSCDGFNLGLNVGAIAGAGVTDHMHQHVVPRWVGDANFMPILASTVVLPELIPVTYAKTRAEIGRELGIGAEVDYRCHLRGRSACPARCGWHAAPRDGQVTTNRFGEPRCVPRRSAASPTRASSAGPATGVPTRVRRSWRWRATLPINSRIANWSRKYLRWRKRCRANTPRPLAPRLVVCVQAHRPTGPPQRVPKIAPGHTGPEKEKPGKPIIAVMSASVAPRPAE